MVHLNGEMARDYVKGEFSMQGSAGMAIIEDADEMFIKGDNIRVFILYLHHNSSFFFTSIEIFSSTSVESTLFQLRLGLRTVTYKTIPYHTLPIRVIP